MNKHDHMHMLRAINQHIKEARLRNTNAAVDDHLEKAKDALWVVADDLGIQLINGG